MVECKLEVNRIKKILTLNSRVHSTVQSTEYTITQVLRAVSISEKRVNLPRVNLIIKIILLKVIVNISVLGS